MIIYVSKNYDVMTVLPSALIEARRLVPYTRVPYAYFCHIFTKIYHYRRILVIYLYVNGVTYKYFYTRIGEYSIKTWEIKKRARGRTWAHGTHSIIPQIFH